MTVKRKIPPGRIIALGFLGLILLGTILLFLPVTHREGQTVSLIDALFISTSATCVTGLSPIVVSEVFNPFGHFVIGFLIQVGGLGVACMGAAFFLLLRRRMGMKDQAFIREGWNVSSSEGLIRLLKMALLFTFVAEFCGGLAVLPVFWQRMPPLQAIGTSFFHAISAFNNAGFDVIGPDSLVPYQGNVHLTLVTAALIILGGLGFIVYWDLAKKRSFKRLTLHSKIVLITTLFLLVGGTLLLLTDGSLGLLDSFFFSVSSRTAGFMTSPVNELSNASLFVLVILMFIGASPGSTGGGIKTTTFFVLFLISKNLFFHKKNQTFHRKLPREVIHKALLLALLALIVLCTATLLLCFLEPEIPFMDLLFETVSAGATVGLSTGITPTLCDGAKIVLTLVMYIGRLGPLTAATVWTIKQESALSYSTESITIG